MKLAYRDRLRMAWELTWPMALIDLTVVVFLHGFLDVQGESADSIWAVAAFFAVSPWVVRRGLNLAEIWPVACAAQTQLSAEPEGDVAAGMENVGAVSGGSGADIARIARALHLDANLTGENPLVVNVGLERGGRPVEPGVLSRSW